MTKLLPIGRRSVEVTVDLFNLANLLDTRWGRSHATTRDPYVPMLQFERYDTAADRGVYSLALPRRNQVEVEASRWRIQLGARFGL